MEIPPKLVVVIVLASAIVGGVIERGVSKKDETKTVEKEVVKNKIITKIVEKYHMDGSVDRDIVIDDGSVIERDKKTDIIIASKPSDWYIHGSAGIRAHYLERVYSLGVDRRILGPIWLGIYGNTQEEVGLRIGMQF